MERLRWIRISSFVLFAVVGIGTARPSAAVDLAVQSTTPARNTMAPVATTVAVTFDRAVLPASVTASSFRVFGRWSGSKFGSYQLSNGNRTVTLDPTENFSAGEMVFVNLSHDLKAADLAPLRPGGYAFSFQIRTSPTSLSFQEIDVMTNRTNGQQTRIYGASASDLDEDGYLDLTTVNEVSADVRVFLNRGDGTGLYHPFLTPQPIGVEASPNEPADFDLDGHSDLCIAAVESNSVWVLMGVGDGTYDPVVEIPVGEAPHGVCVLDVDGDGDLDIVNSNNVDSSLSLLVNDGAGNFAAPAYFESGVTSEYGLAAADMNGDGLSDVVVGSRDGAQILSLLGNGNGTFTAAGAPQSSGGNTWVVALGDVNGDLVLDAATANSGSGNGAVLFGLGNGRFGPPQIIPIGAHTVATDFGDLDGDQDLDLVISSYGGGFWRVYRNNGAGVFALHSQINAPSNPSCAVLLDFDNDGDMDLALSDEIADVVLLEENVGGGSDVEPGEVFGGWSSVSVSPNPTFGGARLEWRAAQDAPTEFLLRDAAGRTLRRAPLAATAHEFVFDGLDADGRPLPAGVYYCELRSHAQRWTDRLVRLR